MAFSLATTAAAEGGLRVVDPNAAHALQAGTEHVIRWETDDMDVSPSLVDIEYTSTKGGEWIVIESGVANTGSYKWAVPEIDSGICLVRVSDSSDPLSFGTSDSCFRIYQINVMKMIFNVLGGLGIFLLGMKNMSEGMQAVAGDKLRRLIGSVTNHPFVACLVGTAITCLIQSSSVTTVMVVGMVNAGLMTLMQAIGVILGANIGTTITGWILVIKIGKYGLPLLGVAAFFYLFSKRDRSRYTAMMLLGLGMVFFGLQLMKTGFAPLKDMPGFEAWFSHFSLGAYSGHIPYWAVMRCCLVGAILTAVVQSSSATLGITIGLALVGGIDFATAAALVLGENIGTCITALLASLGASTNAKRAAYAHMFVNLIGVLWITLIFSWYIQAVVWFVGTDPATPDIANGVTTFPYAAAAIAMTHTGFNVVNVLLLLPFTGVLSRLLKRVVPEKTYEETPHLTFVDVRMLDTPAISIQQSQREIVKMGEIIEKMMLGLRDCLTAGEGDRQRDEKIFKREEILDVMQKEIVEFLGNIMAGNIPHHVMAASRRQLRIADEYESISDYAAHILKFHLKMRNTGQRMSEEGLKEMLALHDQVASYVRFVHEAVGHENKDILPAAETKGQVITHLMKETRSRHMERVGTGETTPLKSLIYTDMLNAYRRIKDHALNVAEVLAGEK